MPIDTAPSSRTAATAARIPVLTSDAEAIRAARDLAAFLAGGAIERDRTGVRPVRELAALDAGGLLAITVPGRHHGADVPATVPAGVIRTIAAVDPAIAQVTQGHLLSVDVLTVLGTPGQRDRLFPDALSGGRPGTGLAERGGKHAQYLKTRRHGRGSPTRLTGRKYYCRCAITALWIGVTALDDDGRLVLALEVASEMFTFSRAGERYDPSWHWRNARTHASHDPVAWKYHHVGNYLLNDVLPPNHGQV